MTIKCTTLKNGIRVLTDERKGARAVGMCLCFNCGGAHEKTSEKGITHLMEHMIFEGTNKKSTDVLTQKLADLGAAYDGLTSSWANRYPIRVLKSDVEPALKLWTEMLQESTFPEERFEKEKQVVLREIDMVWDKPDTVFGELWLKTAYPKTKIAYTCIGTKESVSKLTAKQVRKYWKEHFANNILVCAAQGAITHKKFVGLCEKLLTKFTRKVTLPRIEAEYEGGMKTKIRNQNQDWIFMGFESPKCGSKDYFAASVALHILGKGFTSRLYRLIRGRGWAYSIMPMGYIKDSIRVYGIRLQVSPENVNDVLKIVSKEYANFTQTVTKQEVELAKKNIMTKELLQDDHLSKGADGLAVGFASLGKLVDTAEMCKMYKSVTLKDVKRVAKQMFSTAPTVAIMGPKCKAPTYKTICNWLKGK